MIADDPEAPLPPLFITLASEPYYAIIGRIASNWALLELSIDYTIWGLASITNEHGACLTAQYIGINPRINALMALVKYWNCSKTLLSDLEDFHKKSMGLSEQRNRAVHDPRLLGNKRPKRSSLQLEKH